MICSSLNLDRLIVRLLLRDGLYLGLEGNQGLRSVFEEGFAYEDFPENGKTRLAGGLGRRF
jgi:hypothetical protein